MFPKAMAKTYVLYRSRRGKEEIKYYNVRVPAAVLVSFHMRIY